MNIQEFIKAKEEEFGEKFPPARDGDYTKHPLPHIKHFLSQSLLEYNEKIKEIIEEAPPMTRTECEEGNPIDKDDIITTLTTKDNEKIT